MQLPRYNSAHATGEAANARNFETVPRVLLASRSPRRKWLLTEAGIPFIDEHPGFDDSFLMPGKGITRPEQWVCALAYLKAWARYIQLPVPCENTIDVVLGSDTACVMDGTMIGTPYSRDEARSMIRAFMNREHGVTTGVALIDARARRRGERIVFAESALVHFGNLSDDSLEEYLATDLWQGKAGGYNLLERIEAGWPITYEGDATTIMGLPMQALITRLHCFATGLHHAT